MMRSGSGEGSYRTHLRFSREHAPVFQPSAFVSRLEALVRATSVIATMRLGTKSCRGSAPRPRGRDVHEAEVPR